VTDRRAWGRNPARVQPRDSLASHLDHRREVVEGCRDQLANPVRGFLVRKHKGRLWAEVLGLTHRHPGRHTKGERLFRRRDHMLVPAPDDDRLAIEIGPASQLEVSGQTTADAHGSSPSTTPTSTVPERLAPDSSGPSQCSGTPPNMRMKPAPARASVAAASPATSGAGARTTVSAPGSGEKGINIHGSNPPPSITIAWANSWVAWARSERATVSLPLVPLPVKRESRPRGRP